MIGNKILHTSPITQQKLCQPFKLIFNEGMHVRVLIKVIIKMATINPVVDCWGRKWIILRGLKYWR